MNQDPKKIDNQYLKKIRQVYAVAFEMGFIIALPIVIFGFGGKWIDSHLHTHFFVYLAIVLALILSTLWLYKRIAALAEKLKPKL